MDAQEISAFAAYTAQKQKSLKKKSKVKQKKQKENSINTVMKSLISATESSASEAPEKKFKKKQTVKKDLIETILKAQKESIFKDCAVTTKVDNMFLNESKNKGNKKLKKSLEDISRPVKSKKIKLMNGGSADNSNVVKNSPKNTENSYIINGDPALNIKACSVFLGGDVMLQNKRLKNSLGDTSDPKKSKKRKITNGEETRNTEINKMSENDFFIKSKKAAKVSSSVEDNTESVKVTDKNKSKELIKSPNLTELIYSDSVKIGEEVFSWMLSPMSIKEFFEDCWEKKPLHIQHSDKNYFKHICTLEDFKRALREHDMYFTRNIDVTSYIDGERHTENPEGKAKPAIVWDFYKNGRSIRLLNPQTFIQNIRVLNTTLQEFFHCFVGANIYLTPPGTQGFAPHYDDIEAFVLQLEGEKHWKLYNPRLPEEVLPRESSGNFTEDEIGEPILEVTLQPGDLLYFPRGVIHQAKCLPHVHSLHVTVSCYQKNSWADLLEKVIPVAVQKAIAEDVEFRKGLPIGYLNCLGLVHSDQTSDHRMEMIKKFEELVQKIVEYCPLDAGVDQLAAGYMHDALPPCLSEAEALYGADRNCKMEDENFLNILKNSSDKNLSVKLIRATCVRLVSEEGEVFLYYTTDNSLVYHEHDVSSVSIATKWAQAVEYLIHSYPNFVEMKSLPVSVKINKPGKWKHIIEFVYFLWQKGLLLFDQPLRQICS